jgi:DNA-binding transcriptional ArsR family regulator
MSQHLAVLRRAGLVKERRDGNRVYYVAASAKIKELLRVGGQISLDRVKALL